MPNPTMPNVLPPTLQCPKGRPVAAGSFSCRFCRAYPLHRGDSGCGCSTMRLEITYYSTLCIECAEALDQLTADTRLGKIHRELVNQAEMKYMPSSD